MAAFTHLLCLILLIGVSTATSNKLLVLMIDGFRWDYFDFFEDDELPGFQQFMQTGVKAEYLQPAFPSYTFVNLYSLMTGLHPETHGFVHNYMWDEEHQSEFLIGDNRPEQDQPFWWNGGEPVWITAKKQNKTSFIWYWNGCEVEIRGHRPDFCAVYQDNPNPSRDDFEAALWESVEVLTNGSADLAAVYWEKIDYHAHQDGPGHSSVLGRIRELDDLLVDLQDSLDHHGNINLVMFSDHGMSQRVENNEALIDVMQHLDWADLARAYGSTSGPVLQLWPEEGQEDQVYDAIKDVEHMTVYRKEEIPERYHLKGHYRVPPLLLVADEGYAILRPNVTDHHYQGYHGYDNDLVNMRGIFFARGPDFRSNATVPGLKVTELYNLMCHVMNIEPAPNNGTFENVCDLLQDGCYWNSASDITSKQGLLLLNVLLSLLFLEVNSKG